MSTPNQEAVGQDEWPAPAWFVELCLAADRGDYDRAAECQRRLEAQGWRVTRRKGRRKPAGEGGGA